MLSNNTLQRSEFLVNEFLGVHNLIFCYLKGLDDKIKQNKSPLPLTDPRDAVPQAHHVVHKSGGLA